MGISTRSLLVPGVAAAAVAMTLAPVVVAPSASQARPAVVVPVVHIDEIQLAGIGRDIYDSISAWVQWGVATAEYWVGLIPGFGPPLADQIAINYSDLIQPLIANTVYYLSDVVADPLGFFGWTNSYLVTQAYVGLRYLNAQAGFFGLPQLPPLPFPPAPPLAATRGAVATATASRGSAAPAPAAAAAVTSTVTPAPTRAAARTARPAAAAASADAPDAPAPATPVAATRTATVSSRHEAHKGIAAARPAARAAAAAAG